MHLCRYISSVGQTVGSPSAHPKRRSPLLNRRDLLLIGASSLVTAMPSFAEDRLPVVATFSILGDFVRNVGGDRVEVTTLVGPNGDVHVYLPTPADARKLSIAKVVFINGLGLEGWMTRLVTASGTKAPIIIATKGVTSRDMKNKQEGRRVMPDPHAWQSIANARIYVANIRDGLMKVDPTGAGIYDTNAKSYLVELDALEKDVRAAISKIPVDRRKIIINHDAFGYFGDAYGMEFIAPGGLSTDSEPSARGCRKNHHPDPNAKNPCRFLGERHRSQIDATDCRGKWCQDWRQTSLRCAIGTQRAGRKLYRINAQQRA
jgi:zinc/manganese transport system substrate-binding protein